MPRASRSITSLTLALALGAPVAVMAQGTQTGSISARVVGKDGAPIAGAEVRLTSPNLQGVRVLVTDAEGRAAGRLLPPGKYRIQVSKAGFQTVTVEDRIGLEMNFAPRIILSREIGATVEVFGATATGPEKTESKVTYNYTKETMDTLPVPVNSALEAVYLSPGIAKSIMSDKGGVEIRGANGTGSLTLVDGQNTMDNVYVGQRLKINMDDVEETQVLTGAIPAEYGYIEGGVVNSITKSGGNEFSGNLRINLENQNWNAVTPLTQREAILKSTRVEKSIGIGGPIIKDVLWFYGSYFNTAPAYPYSLDGALANLPFINYSEQHGDYRRDLKLTYTPVQNHTITLSWHNFKDAWNRNASGAGELGALSMFNMKGEFYTLAYRGTLGDNMALSVKYGEKKQEYGTTVNALAWGPPIFNYMDGNTYASGAWDPNDPQPDVRNNKTINLKLSYFFNAAGSHELDLGYDYYEGVTKSSGFQSAYYINIPGVGNCNIYTYQVDEWDGATKQGTYLPSDLGGAGSVGNAFFAHKYVPDTNTIKTNGFYFNDKYILNNHWNFNIGARFDSYDNSNLSKGKVGSNSGFSPRLGAKYDVNGDGGWVVGLAYSHLLGRPLETTWQLAGYVFNPIQYQYNNLLALQAEQAGHALTFPVATIYNLNSYDTAHPLISDAVFNMKVDPKLKMTTVDEWQGSLAYSFHDTTVGTGYVRTNLVKKTWNNLVARRRGMDGTVTSPVYGTADIWYFYNEPLAKREYRALELDASTTYKHFHLGANATWSTIYGNYSSDGGTSNPGALPTYFNFPIDPDSGAVIYDPRNYGGYNGLMQGRIAGAAPRSGGMSPAQYNVMADYFIEGFLGRTSFGLVYQFRSGQPFDFSRTVNPSAFSAAGPNSAFGGATQVLGTPGDGVYGSASYTNLAITQDFKLWKVGGRSVNAWLKLAVTNVFNHQQILTWDMTYATVNDLNAPWAPKNSNFGKATRTEDYATPRTVRLYAGFKF